MNILIITGSFYPAQEGGPTNAVYWLASGLASSGYNVRILATDKNLEGQYPSDTWVEMNGFSVLYRSKKNYDALISGELSRCDYLIRSGVCSIRAHFLNLRAIYLKKKVIISPRGELFFPAVFHKGKFYGFLKLFFLRLVSMLYGKGVIFHATSEEEKEQIRKVMGNKGKVITIPNYMILPAKVLPDIAENDGNYLLYVGRIAPIKALDKLIRALALSNGFIRSGMVLRILGNNKGQYYEVIKKLIDNLHFSDRVIFDGVVEGTEKDKIIANARYLFLVSDSENFGNVVIESLAQGTPVVASKGTPWQIVSEKNAGYWVDNNPEELSGIIDEIIEKEPLQYSEQRRNAYDLAQRFDIYKNMADWKSVIGQP